MEINPVFTDEQIAADPILKYFAFDHLPAPLRSVSASFAVLASVIVGKLPRSPERTVSLRKLLEAKDAGVRANIGNQAKETFLTRLADETDALWAKMAKLKTFIDSPDFAKVPADDQRDLRRQYDAMDRYHEILAHRLDTLSPKHARLDPGAIDAGDDVLDVRITGGGSDETPIPFA